MMGSDPRQYPSRSYALALAPRRPSPTQRASAAATGGPSAVRNGCRAFRFCHARAGLAEVLPYLSAGPRRIAAHWGGLRPARCGPTCVVWPTLGHRQTPHEHRPMGTTYRDLRAQLANQVVWRRFAGLVVCSPLGRKSFCPRGPVQTCLPRAATGHRKTCSLFRGLAQRPTRQRSRWFTVLQDHPRWTTTPSSRRHRACSSPAPGFHVFWYRADDVDAA